MQADALPLSGLQRPRFQMCPDHPNPSTEIADLAISLGEAYGLTLDPWQQNTLRTWMRTSPDGKWLASSWGLSVPRQNGKNAALEVVEMALMVLSGTKILHTSHLLGSARKAFKRLQYFFGRQPNDPGALFPDLNAMVVELRRTNGQECIILDNGGLIEFGARTGGAGRGSSFDMLIIDEAQEYEEDEQEALEPTISASPSGDPVIVYMGTPPRFVGFRGEPFVRVRNAAVTGDDKTIAWVEHSARGDVDDMSEAELRALVHDRAAWAEANPALGIRVVEKTVLAEMSRMAPRSFARERLNMWPKPVEKNSHPYGAAAWDGLKREDPDESWPLAAVGLDMNPERTKVTIVMAYWADNERIHLEVAADAPFNESGTSALADWVWKRCKRRIPVVLDAFSPARSIEPMLASKKMLLRVLNSGEWGQACMGFQDAIRDKAITHYDQVQLTESIVGAVKEPMGRGGAWKLARESLETDLSPAVAAVCALFGAIKFGRRPAASTSERAQKGHAFVQ